MNHSFQFQIEQSDAGRRLDEFFASRFGSLSRMRIANLIEAGACVVNGVVARAGYHILAGDEVDVSFDDGAPTSMSPESIPLEIVYEDEHLIIIVKPAGMLVHPTMSVKTGTLANALAFYLNREVYTSSESWVPGSGLQLELADRQINSNLEPETKDLEPRPSQHGDRHALTRPGIVHRLDRATSGLIVIARTPRALTTLSRHFRKRLVEKRYLALVTGRIEDDTGSINAPIGRDPDQRPRWRVIEGGKSAETRFRVLERMTLATLLELEPVTGRTNQLRIHCAHIGHPIVGDEAYAYRETERTDQQSSNKSDDETRLCLHASSLAFHHPASGTWMEFSSHAPDQMQALIRQYQR
jgi:23S rRNA pseudouridine1911/1915/1917 synthase